MFYKFCYKRLGEGYVGQKPTRACVVLFKYADYK
jgi:hypothetical protein